MKRLLLLVIPVLVLLILAAPVAAEEKHGNSPDTQAASEVERGKSADAQSRNDERKADSEDEEANSEEEVSAEKNGNGAQRLQFFEVPGGNWETVSDIEVEGSVNVVAPSGDVALVIQGNIKSELEADKEYQVWVRSVSDTFIGTFTTNGTGHGSFHFNVLAEDLDPGTYDIQVAINDPGVKTVVATPHDPLLTVTIGPEDED